MKNFALLLMLVLSGFSSKAQSCPVPINLEGKIINMVDLGTECGYSKLASVIEFEIIGFSDGTYKQKNIGIIFRCPEFYGPDYFEVGKVYEVKVEMEDNFRNNFDYTVQNAAALEKYNLPVKYWALNGNVSKIR